MSPARSGGCHSRPISPSRWKRPGRALPDAARPIQQPQFLQVQGLQRQPPDLQEQVQAVFALSVLVMVILPILP